LRRRKGLKGKVQTIYFDPPYGIKFGSNWQVSTRKRDVKDGRIEDATRQPEQVRAFRDTWRLGIHSYLAYLRDRLIVARELLTHTGSVFVQIGDENVHLVRSVLDEVFSSDNFVAVITFKKTTGATSVLLPSTADYIVWYAKDITGAKFRPLLLGRTLGSEGAEAYQFVEDLSGVKRRMTEAEIEGRVELPDGARAYRFQILESHQGRASGPGTAMYFPVEFEGRTFYPSGTRGWTTTADGLRRLLQAQRLAAPGNTLSYIRYLDDFPAVPLGNL
jgi:adenine-specific DNA-methyltransferase